MGQVEPDGERVGMLTSLAAAGDERGVRRILESDPGAVDECSPDGTSCLCAAALWGHSGILRLLLEAQAFPGMKNETGARWTALHAAAAQEQGKACMLLLDFKANPLEKDLDGVSPCDYASCSEAVWPLFASRGCERVPKAELVQKGVLRKASAALEQQLAQEAHVEPEARRGLVSEYSRPGSSYVVSREFPARPGSSAVSRPPGTGSRQASKQASRPIDILEEEDANSPVKMATAGLRSLAV